MITRNPVYAAAPLTVTVFVNADNRNRINRLSQDQQLTGLTHLHQIIDPLETRLNDLETTTQTVQQQVREEAAQFKGTIAQVHKLLNPLKLKVEQFGELETLTQQQIRELREHQQQAKEATLAQMDQFFERIREHLAQLEALANQANPQTLTQLQTLETTVGQLQQQLQPLKIQVEQLEQQAKSPELQAQITELRELLLAQQTQISKELEPLNSQIQELQTRGQSPSNTLKTEQQIYDLKTAIARLEETSAYPTSARNPAGATTAAKVTHTITPTTQLNPGQGNHWHCAQTLQGHLGSVNTLAIAPHGQTFASGSDDQSIKLWQLATGQDVRTLGTPDTSRVSPVKTIALSPNGQMLASAGNDKVIQLWQVTLGQRIGILQGHNGAISSLTFSPDGEQLISGSADKTVRIWQVKTGQLDQTLTGHSEWFSGVKAVAMSPNGKTLASSSDDKTIKLWDLTQGKITHTLAGHHDTVNDLTFSPDGQFLFSASSDSTIKGWRLDNGREAFHFMGHRGHVYSLAISPNGQVLASGSWDRSIKLWDLQTGRELDTLTGHTAAVMTLAFAQERYGNGSSPLALISGSSDHTVRIWRDRVKPSH
ncbi:MAG: hypothetical protein F6J87_09760 [Spirulina sp. SIO3F2]|nr:hypothetical protein [Spirulina sp. SIO3F2]